MHTLFNLLACAALFYATLVGQPSLVDWPLRGASIAIALSTLGALLGP